MVQPPEKRLLTEARGTTLFGSKTTVSVSGTPVTTLDIDPTAPGVSNISGLQAALDLKAGLLVATVTINDHVTFDLTHANKVCEFIYTGGAQAFATVPPNSAVPYAIGTVIGLYQAGTAVPQFAPGAGVTIRSRGGALKMGGQYAEAYLRKRGTDEWVLTGDITA